MSFLLRWAQCLLDAVIHRLDVAGVSCDLNVEAELKPIVAGASPGTLMDFAASSNENLEVLLTGTGFVCCQGVSLGLDGWCHFF